MEEKKPPRPVDDEELAAMRFVDQPGQWVNCTPPSVKKKQQKEWEKLMRMMEPGKKLNGRRNEDQ